MATYTTNEFKPGLKIVMDGDPWTILGNEFVKPGKGQAFNRVKLRNLRSGRVLDKTFRSGENVSAAEVVELEMQYLYSDGEFWHFMDVKTYDQHSADAAAMGSGAQWLKGQETCQVTLWNGAVFTVAPPNFVVLKVAEAAPGVRGDTATGGNKTVVLETGAKIQVPLFIKRNETVRVDTRSGEYIGREKD